MEGVEEKDHPCSGHVYTEYMEWQEPSATWPLPGPWWYPKAEYVHRYVHTEYKKFSKEVDQFLAPHFVTPFRERLRLRSCFMQLLNIYRVGKKPRLP